MKDRIVCNTGPLIALAIVDRLDLLKLLFHEVVISETVHQEILRGGAASAGLSAYGRATWIRTSTEKGASDLLLDSILDAGEASVIQLARAQGTEFVLIDDRKARKVARNVYGLRVIGTARVLVEAKHHGFLKSVEKALCGMREGGYWIHESIVKTALREAGEEPELI